MPGTNASLPAREPLLRALIDICGPDFARPARSIDVVAGRRASFIAVPATVRSVVDTLGLAASRGLAVFARGSGSKINWGTPPPGVDLIVDTGRLNGMWDHGPGHPTVEVGMGTPVSALQAALALQGQRLAVDPPSPTATVGGMLALNEAGPMRHRYGTPAEQVDRITYVDVTGEVGESDGEDGRPGIADVDGVLTSATLRVHRLPPVRRWVSVPVSTPLQVHNLVDETLAQQLEPSAIEVDLPAPTVPRPTELPPGSLAVLIEGDGADVEERAGRLARLLSGSISELAPRWWGRYPFDPGDVAVRMSVPIADLHAAVYSLSDAAGGLVPVRGSAGAGTVHAVLPGSLPAERVEAIVDSVRNVLMARGGRAVLISAPPEVARQVDMAGRRDLI